MFTQTVALKDVSCYAFHGFYPEEQLTGSHFLVSIEVTFSPANETEDLQKTVNYEVINAVILEEMKNTQKLLETVVKNMMDKILIAYPFLLTAEVGIRKLHPPMLGEVGSSFVGLKYAN
ncbi:dihydroneopterin aldolase [Pedobacter sp. Du54]|uniref:dihydroneopterin aldolase n=1 Tax=Pedobacter anseongensis TaxID=3133439 RepID=UPI00309774A8